MVLGGGLNGLNELWLLSSWLLHPSQAPALLLIAIGLKFWFGACGNLCDLNICFEMSA